MSHFSSLSNTIIYQVNKLWHLWFLTLIWYFVLWLNKCFWDSTFRHMFIQDDPKLCIHINFQVQIIETWKPIKDPQNMLALSYKCHKLNRGKCNPWHDLHNLLSKAFCKNKELQRERTKIGNTQNIPFMQYSDDILYVYSKTSC